MAIDADAHGLQTLARRWNPRSMRASELGAAMLDAINAATADALNPLIDLEQYAPIILNPTRCLENDVERILALNGIVRARSLSPDQARRLAVIAQALRSWRGAFRSLRAVIGALTGGPVILRPWVGQRVIVDESTWDFIVLPIDGYRDVTQAFLLGQGPDATYDAAQVEDHAQSLARTILDTTEYVPCYALTAWRDGFAGWGAVGDIELISSTLQNEYESVDLGPGVGSTSTLHRITAPTRCTADTPRHWATVWFKTTGATALSSWRVALASDKATPATYYGAVVNVGNGYIQLVRVDAGVDTVLQTDRINVPDGDTGDWHRLDLIMVLNGGAMKLRALVDHNPTGWGSDSPGPFPQDLYLEVLVDNAEFPTGRLRIAALTATE